MMDILLSSRNKDKIREIKNLLVSLPVRILTPYEITGLPEIDEDRDTLLGNALKKGRVLSRETGLPTIADDTGLFIDALSGEPGVYSARYAGESCTYDDNCRKVLRLLKNKIDRTGRFITIAVFYIPAREPLIAEGIAEGKITEEKRGNNGFGYDPIFQVKGSDKTFAEMNDDEKNLVSHRGIAFRNLAEKIKIYLSS